MKSIYKAIIFIGFKGSFARNRFTSRRRFVSAKGSIEYGVRYLHTPLLLIVGHSMCGAVKAAMTDFSNMEPAIKDNLSTIHVPLGNPENAVQVKEAVEVNVNEQVNLAMKLFEPELANGKLLIVGAVYDFRNDYKKALDDWS